MTLMAALVTLASCSPGADPISSTTSVPTTTSTTTTTVGREVTTTRPMQFSMTSPAFDEGGSIPAEYTCDGLDLSPELDIVGLPERTKALALIVEDPDAPLGVWYHWVEFDIPASPGAYEIPRDATDLGTQGVNSWNLVGYKGPCPPEGDEHHYLFEAYALESDLGLLPGVDADEVKASIDEVVIDEVTLTGVYGR